MLLNVNFFGNIGKNSDTFDSLQDHPEGRLQSPSPSRFSSIENNGTQLNITGTFDGNGSSNNNYISDSSNRPQTQTNKFVHATRIIHLSILIILIPV